MMQMQMQMQQHIQQQHWQLHNSSSLCTGSTTAVDAADDTAATDNDAADAAASNDTDAADSAEAEQQMMMQHTTGSCISRCSRSVMQQKTNQQHLQKAAVADDDEADADSNAAAADETVAADASR
jgi:hypothetical protein